MQGSKKKTRNILWCNRGKMNPSLNFLLIRNWTRLLDGANGGRLAEADKYIHYVCLNHNQAARKNWAFHKDLSDALKRVDEFGKVVGNHDNRESFCVATVVSGCQFYRKSICAVCRHYLETDSLMFTFLCLFPLLFYLFFHLSYPTQSLALTDACSD